MPVKNIKKPIAFAKAQPGQVQYGTAGNGSGAHLFTELFRSMAGIELQYIPYRVQRQRSTNCWAVRSPSYSTT